MMNNDHNGIEGTVLQDEMNGEPEEESEVSQLVEKKSMILAIMTAKLKNSAEGGTVEETSMMDISVTTAVTGNNITMVAGEVDTDLDLTAEIDEIFEIIVLGNNQRARK